MASTPVKTEHIGLDFWMAAVLRECANARRNFAPGPIHDLRVALRRCRSIADGFISLDPHPAWRQMKKQGKKLFRQLGALRDTQVMMEWVQRLAPPADNAAAVVKGYLAERESRLKESASNSLQNFDKKKWTAWIHLLSKRARRVPPGSMVFRHMALELWTEARELHRQALRNRTHISYHRLRIGLKKFRYTVENFLPGLYASWGPELRELQDRLGEMHDLQVLWQTARTIKAFDNEESRRQWRERMSEESGLSLGKYREKMLGKNSLALAWRSELPDSDGTRIAALTRLRAWASFRDPDFPHSELVAKLALQIYDGLDSLALIPEAGPPDARLMLEAAAVAHDTGKSKTDKKHHLASCRLIRKMEPPQGFSAENFRYIALIVRSHRGRLPRPGQNALSCVPDEQIKAFLMLCGILRLANAFDLSHRKRVRRLELKRNGDVLHILAPGYSKNNRSAEALAAARHLLEVACGFPILIEPGEVRSQSPKRAVR
jgi:CHAD domain-containing protein